MDGSATSAEPTKAAYACATLYAPAGGTGCASLTRSASPRVAQLGQAAPASVARYGSDSGCCATATSVAPTGESSPTCAWPPVAPTLGEVL